MTGPTAAVAWERRLRWPLRGLILLTLLGLIVLALAQVPHRWSWRSVWGVRGELALGLGITLGLSVGAMAVGLVLGAGGCLLRIARLDALRFLGTCYVEVVRNTPLLVQLYLAYFCIFPALRYNNPPVIGTIALGVFAGAYITEILRAGVESIEGGQTEAAVSLGLSRLQTLRYVIAPQAIRRVIPPLTGQFVSLVKDSSLLSTISITEVFFRATTNASLGARYFEFYLVVALLYFAINFPLSRISVWLETRLDRDRA